MTDATETITKPVVFVEWNLNHPRLADLGPVVTELEQAIILEELAALHRERAGLVIRKEPRP